jgi:hypothetical protein
LEAVRISGTLTAVNGDTSGLTGFRVRNAFTTQNNSETIALIAQAYFEEPGITKGSDTVTAAATVYIENAPTEATSNYALWVDSGDSRFDGDVTINAALSKSSGSFRIAHPHPDLAETHELVHSFIEGPRADLIYRGTVILVAGTAVVDLDTAAGITAGTWALLCRDAQVFSSNETGWSPVRGTVVGSTLTIECEDGTCTDTVSWMVVAERQDQHMIDTDWTDEAGRPITEPLKPPPDPPGHEEDDDEPA